MALRAGCDQKFKFKICIKSVNVCGEIAGIKDWIREPTWNIYFSDIAGYGANKSMDNALDLWNS